ncbi:MAG: alpha/beta hydrolase [Bacteroidia bacterium]|nr:alpha/beta hydrolase [Bacteroidia bacterium]
MIHTTETLLNTGGVHLYTKYSFPLPGRPVLVFLHDSLGCTQLWRDLPERLVEETQCNVLVYDRLGYGKSDPLPSRHRAIDYLEREAAVLNDLLQQLHIADAILFGHSDGASISLIAAALYPERVRAVVSEAAHIFVEDITLRGILHNVDLYERTDLKQRLERYHGDKTEDVFRSWADTWTRADFRSWNIEHLLPRIQCPVLVMQGDADEFGTLAQVEGILKGVGEKAERCVIPGAGHTPHKEAAKLAFERSAAFVKGLSD